MAERVDKRKDPSELAKRLVWAAAAGRCTFCNASVIANDDLGEPVPIGELAHNVGATSNSPRGDSDLTRDERAEAENLLLVCRNCHKPVDEHGNLGRWSVEELQRRKREHEQRIHDLTAIGADRKAYLVRVVGQVRGTPPELSRDTVLQAATAAGLYPQRLPEAHFSDVDLDLTNRGDQHSRSDFEACVADIDRLAARIHDGVRHDAIHRVAVFGFARVPLLVQLGASLDDKLETLVFHRHRVDDGNAWTWPQAEPSCEFEINQLQTGSDHDAIALVLSLSGEIKPGELPPDIDASFTIYEIHPVEPAERGPKLLKSPADLARFESQLRRFLAQVEQTHGKVPSIAVFPAVGVGPAVTLGRVLMPDVSPGLRVFDRDDGGVFFEALAVRG